MNQECRADERELVSVTIHDEASVLVEELILSATVRFMDQREDRDTRKSLNDSSLGLFEA